MNNDEIRKYLKKIINSKCFSRSKIYNRLLEYLTESTLKGQTPKEFTIGVDVFYQKMEKANDSYVRVQVFKLRKILETYYNIEGKNDSVRFVIPKGSYSLKFKTKREIQRSKHYKYLIYIFIFVVLLASYFSYSLFFGRSDLRKQKKSKFWHEILCNKRETIIVSGDFYVFRDKKTDDKFDRYRIIRDVHLNSLEEFKEMIKHTDSLKMEDYETTDLPTYMTRGVLYSMKYLIPMLDRNGVPFNITISSDFFWNVYKNKNIIYIGSFKSLSSLSIVTDKLNIYYDHENDIISFVNNGDTIKYYSKYYTNEKKSMNIDYTLVAKVPGSDNNVINLFVSNNDIGCIEAIKYFTQPDSLKNFEKNILKKSTYFKAFYKSEGIVRTGTTFYLLNYEAITDSTLVDFWRY
jgi:hypothetical protein